MGFLSQLRQRIFGGTPVMVETANNPTRKVVLVHGYSDRGASFIPWAKELRQRGFATELIEVVTYRSLTNEVTIKDLGEGFERALRKKAITGEFDAIVHSTGMLVVRAWLTANRGDFSRRNRLRHLIGFAPATWGSPLAHRGRGWLGSLFKGNKETDPVNAPDFLEAGDLILDSLELGSRFTWDLAHVDLFGPDTFYGTDPATPYPFIFCGNEPYPGLRRLVNEPGTDGTVRFAGVSLDSRKFVADLTKEEGHKERLDEAKPTNVDAPVIFVRDRNHGTILSHPEPELVNFVVRALNVAKADDFIKWRTDAREWSKKNQPAEVFQHFVIHMADERGDPIHDYHVQLLNVKDGRSEDLQFDLDLHPYQADKSFRSFHVNLTKLRKELTGTLWMRITLSSGTILVAYEGKSNKGAPEPPLPARHDGETDEQYQIRLDSRPTEIYLQLSQHLDSKERTNLFANFTTTLVEITVNREPLPFGDALARLCHFEDLAELGV
jgi:hypothetical protein